MYFQRVIISPYDAIHLQRNLLVFYKKVAATGTAYPCRFANSQKPVGLLSFVALSSEVAFCGSIEWQANDAMPHVICKKKVLNVIYTISCACGDVRPRTPFRSIKMALIRVLRCRDETGVQANGVRIHQADERGCVLKQNANQKAYMYSIHIPNNNTSNLFKLKCFV